jgi:flagellum-specific ATP synthase
MLSFEEEIKMVKASPGMRISGRVTHVIGLLIESIGPSVSMGEMCYTYNKFGDMMPCEVVGFKEDKVLLMALGEMDHIAPGSEVHPTGKVHKVPVSSSMCGRILDALGNPIDGKGPIIPETYYPATSPPPEALSRERINNILSTGIKAIDSTCTMGQGQRIGIFSGSGVGKSMLLGMISQMSEADINVIALIGERGREVREFIDKNLGPKGLARSVVIVVTSDKAALLRTKGANIATAIAEYFRDLGKNVVLMMDSVTRYAMALREIGLAVGEPPTTRGYTPSVFAYLPKLLERAGTSDKGSITGIYTVLVESDDMNDPVADTVRSIIDGHIVLSRKLASANHFPAIDVLGSLSRVMSDIANTEQFQRAGKLRDLLQVYKDAEDLINIGAYSKGSNPKIDKAITLIEEIRSFLKQGHQEAFEFNETQELLSKIISS